MLFDGSSEKFKDLYDPERKAWFIYEYGATDEKQYGLYRFFVRVSEHEKKLGKDVCCMSESEIAEALSQSLYTRASTKESQVSTLRAYFRWCEQHHFQISNANLKSLASVSVDAIRQRYIARPSALQEYLDKLLPDTERTQSDRLYRGYLWLAFSGVPQELSDRITSDDVDMENMRIVHDGKRYPIYPEAAQVLRFLSESETILFDNGNYKKDRKRVDGRLLLRGIRGDADYKALGHELSRRTLAKYKDGTIDMRLTYNGTRMSGRFYRERVLEIMTGQVNVIRLAQEDIELLGKEYTTETEYNKDVKKRALLLKREYEAWCLAFEM